MSRHWDEGFTLLEVLISLAILSGVIVTVLSVMNSHLAASIKLEDSSGAALLAREKLEQLRLYGAPETGKSEKVDGYTIEYGVEEVRPGIKKVCARVSGAEKEQVDVCAYVQKND